MPEIDPDMCRKAAAECIELARITTDSARKEILIRQAQEWLKLAYAKSDTEFERHLAEMNDAQMTRVQRQPMQQQQSKTEPKDEN
jgi:hypothetical protein